MLVYVPIFFGYRALLSSFCHVLIRHLLKVNLRMKHPPFYLTKIKTFSL